MNLEVPTSIGKIVYLDQNGWINLAKIYYGNPSETETHLLDMILKTSDNGSAIFPISMVHLKETNKISNIKWREQLATLMANISKSYTITPYWTNILELEIRNLIFEALNLPKINILKYWLGKGIPHLIGLKPSVVSDVQIDPEVLKKLEKGILEVLDDPKSLEFILSKKFSDKTLEMDENNTINEFEKIRKNLQNIKDNNLRRRLFLAHNITATITPKLVKTLINFKLPKEFINIIIPQDDIEGFLTNLPTALCEFTLLYYRDQQLQRPIEVNDIADVWHLTLAIPYSNIVITENMWASISRQAKLDKKCNTIILSSIYELSECL